VTAEQLDHAWEFTDDRGVTARGGGRPPRIGAYTRAGAALDAYGVRPVAVYGSGHDSAAAPEPATSGALDFAAVGYLGPGAALDERALRAADPDLLVDVTYDGTAPYAVDEGLAAAAGVPVAALSVSGGVTLEHVVGRFGALAAALGADGTHAVRGAAPGTAAAGTATNPDGEWAAARQELRDLAASAARAPRVLVLSPAGPDQVHVARPDAWPELSHLAGLGLDLLRPGPSASANWLTTPWDGALALGDDIDLVLSDVRGHATQPAELADLPAWRRLTASAAVLPWNPELPPAPAVCAAFLRDVAAALRRP
jgi:iron complex transport system substrate-binding protein